MREYIVYGILISLLIAPLYVSNNTLSHQYSNTQYVFHPYILRGNTTNQSDNENITMGNETSGNETYIPPEPDSQELNNTPIIQDTRSKHTGTAKETREVPEWLLPSIAMVIITVTILGAIIIVRARRMGETMYDELEEDEDDEEE